MSRSCCHWSMGFGPCKEDVDDHVDGRSAYKEIAATIRSLTGTNSANAEFSRCWPNAIPSMEVAWVSSAGLSNVLWLGCINLDDSVHGTTVAMTSTKHSCHSDVP
jgi:hypothetical protein